MTPVMLDLQWNTVVLYPAGVDARDLAVDPTVTLPAGWHIGTALEATGAHHELDRFDTNPEYRDLLSARVAEHLKVLRRKITERGLAGPGVRLSDEVAVRVLIEHGVIAASDLGLLSDPAWCSRQEDLWCSRELRAGRLARRRTRADLEPHAGAAPTGSGHDRRVLPHRNRAAEEMVTLVDRVADRALPVGHRPVR